MSWGFCTQGGLRNCRQRLAAWWTVLPCPLRVAAVDKSKTDLQSALACAKELWNNFINFIWVVSELFAMAAIFIYIRGLCHKHQNDPQPTCHEAGPGCQYITSTWAATATAKHMGLSKKLSISPHCICYKEKDVPNSKPLVFEGLLQVCLRVGKLKISWLIVIFPIK